MTLFAEIDDHPVVKAARDLRPLLRENRDEADRTARIVPSVRDAMGEAGMFRLLAPMEAGGHEVSMAVMVAALEELASGDAGAAWHAANAIVAGLITASLEVDACDRLHADPGVHFAFSAVPGAVARAVDGGFEVTGRWPFVTGVRDAAWAVLSGVVHDGNGPRQVDGAPDLRLFVMRSDQLMIEDTWSAATAMRSSGSHAARVESAFVEHRLAYSFRQPRIVDRSLYRIPMYLPFMASAIGIVLGVLGAALEGTKGSAQTKRSSIDGSIWSELTTVRQTVARASAVHHTLRAGTLTALDDVQRKYAASSDVPPRDRAIAWATMFHVGDSARETISRLAAAASSEAYLAGHDTERASRDIHAISVAFERLRSLDETSGAVQLGGLATHPAF